MREVTFWFRVKRRLRRDLAYYLSFIFEFIYLLINRWSREPIIAAEGGVTVSLTSHGSRIETVFCTIESIGKGVCKPGQLILWINEKKIFENLPETLKRLQRRGLTVRLCENFGPHTKYFPVIESGELPELLVTADDDIFYSRNWLKRLTEENRRTPDTIVCYRAHRVEVSEIGIAPYQFWQPCSTSEASYLNFATGVSGVIYPKNYLLCLKLAGREFASCAPRADDVWLYATAIRNGFEIRQIFRRPIHFLEHPRSQKIALHIDNVMGGRNDVQIANTCTARDIELLLTSLK
ncbi:hypothetical protein [Paraburkholderia sp. D1E]|uniref:hypothetical protein n=1 Tax=Paraburkholderia sp. D1E TaxID=3461398 RepID=UPI0040458A54